MKKITSSVNAARAFFAPRSREVWTQRFYQYANRLAYQFFLTRQNGLQSSLVFLYFTNATDVDGPSSEYEWRGATRLIHAVLGLPPDLTRFGVYHAYVDARHLTDSQR